MSLADNNPLFNSEYLLGPIETIVCSQRALTSGHLSLHDVTEAYRTLSTRVRESSCHLSVVSAPFPALEPLRDNGSTVVATLRRDISRGVHSSVRHKSSDHSPRPSGPTAEAMSWELTRDISISGPLINVHLYVPLQRSEATLMVLLAQDLGLLLGDVISIIPRPQLPSSKVSKTTILSSWVVRTQRLPKDVLLPRMEDLILCLKLNLEAAVRDTPSVIVTVVDALHCIVNLLTFHRHIFVERLAGLMPFVFPLIMHTSSQLRHHAAVVLASLSNTLITYRTLVGENTLETICTCTNSFLTPETTRRPTSSRKLPHLLDAAVSSTNSGSVGENSPWALTVVASFTVLLGPSLFLRQGPLKLVMNIAQKALRHRPGRDLNPLVWRTFIWSMTQLFSQRSLTSSGNIEIIQRCVLVLKQALHAGLGAALIVALLEMVSRDFQNEGVHKWAVSSVIDIIHDMLSSKCQDIRNDACRILGCLTCGVGATGDARRETNWTADSFLSRVLFGGSLLHADKLQVEEMARTTDVFSPRSLSQEDILLYWAPLSSCFVLVVRDCLKHGDADLTTAALPVWQSLLLAQAQPIQGNDQNTASADFGLQLSSLFSQFLPEPCVLLSGEADSVAIQLQSLIISKQLWVVIQNIFSRTRLTPVASSFLTAILQRAFYLADREVLTNWSLLCSALIVVGIPNVFEFISHQDETQSALEIKRHLWRLVATHGDSPKPTNWQNSISMLVFPMGSWSMSEDDLDIWERALERNLSVMATSSEAVDIVDGVVSKCPAIGPSFSINTALRVGLAILRHLNLDEGNSISTRTLSYLYVILTTSYPPQSNTADAASALIKAFHRMIIALPVSSLEPVIVAVQTGLALWIEDKNMSLSDEQFNDLVMPLYDSLLQRLQTLPLSATSLNALVPLLTAAFSRIPPPALGPAAFRRFFYAVHARLAAPSNAYSDELRVCLDACVGGYGGEWPSGMVPLSSTSQTQSQFHLEARSMIEVPVLPAVVEEQIPHLRSIEHEVVPDSQYAISDAAFLNAQNVPSPTRFVTEPSKENHESQERTGPFHNPETKKRRLPQDMPASKRHRVTTSTNDDFRTRSVPLTRIPSPVVPGRRSNSTPKASPHSRLVMDCVEVVPLRHILHRREAEAKRHGERGKQLGSELDDHAFDVTPERPFVPRVSRALQEKDEIVPETPDVVLRPARMSLPTGRESSPGNGSPTRLLGKAQPLEGARVLTMATRLASALHEVHDMFSRPGVSQMPVEELADSAQLLDSANIQLRRALARKAGKNVTAHPA